MQAAVNKSRKILYYSYLLLLSLSFVASILILRHCWFISKLDVGAIEKIYPRFHFFVNSVGENAPNILLLLICGTGLSFLYVIYKIMDDKKNFTLLIVSTSICLIALELTLRFNGFVPGFHTRSRYFKPVETLVELDGFYADESGIFRVSEKAKNLITKRIASGEKGWNFENNREVIEVFCIVNENLDLINGNITNSFSHFYSELLRKKQETLTDMDSAIIEFVKSPINSDGFRSIAFKQYKNKKPSILLLGDSFTWGHTTKNKSSSFADELLAMGYTVYNTGISGADVAQYLAVARKYIPLLKPDFVVVNFYIGNDIANHKREIKPFQPVFYATNAGNLMAFQNGIQYNSAKEAYAGVLNAFSIDEKLSITNWIFFSTVISTHFWKLLDMSGYFPYLKNQPKSSAHSESSKYYHNVELYSIKKIAEENSAVFILSSLPEIYRFKEKRAKDFPDVFGNLDYVEMEVDKSDYSTEDAHFNEKGHMRYAFFLDSLIKLHKKSKNKQP